MDVTMAVGWGQQLTLFHHRGQSPGAAHWFGVVGGTAVPTGPPAAVMPWPGVMVALGSLLALLARQWVTVPSIQAAET